MHRGSPVLLLSLLWTGIAFADFPLELVQTIQLPPNVAWDVQHWMNDSTYGWACVQGDSVYYRLNLDDSTSAALVNVEEGGGCEYGAHRVLIFRSPTHMDEPTVGVMVRKICQPSILEYDLFAKLLLPTGETFGPVLEYLGNFEGGCIRSGYFVSLFPWPPPPDTAQGIFHTRVTYRDCSEGAGDDLYDWSGGGSVISSGNAGQISDIGNVYFGSMFARFDQAIGAFTGRYEAHLSERPCMPPYECDWYWSYTTYRRVQLGFAEDSILHCNIEPTLQPFPVCPLLGVAAQIDGSGTERVFLGNGECRDPVTFDLLWENPSAVGWPVYAVRLFDSENERILVWVNGNYFNVFDASDGTMLGTTTTILGTPQYLLKQENAISEIVTYETETRTVRIYMSVLDTLPQCPPSPVPLAEEFDQSQLDSCWYFAHVDSSHWSLTERPGWLRVVTQTADSLDAYSNVLLRRRPAEPCRIETVLDFEPSADEQAAGIVLRLANTNTLMLRKAYWGSPLIEFTVYSGDSVIFSVSLPANTNTTHLRLEWLSTSVAAFWSDDGINWSFVGHTIQPWLTHNNVKIGLFATNGANSMAPEASADFDRYSLQTIPGTLVSGSVSGVWTANGSPYLIIGYSYVESGAELVVSPGVDVLFAGPYWLSSSSGLIRAIGAETDSIRFGRAYPSESTASEGIRLECCSETDTNHFVYCVFDQLTAGYYDAALSIHGHSAVIEHCKFVGNNEHGLRVLWPSQVLVSDSRFEGNTSRDGAAMIIGGYPMPYTTDITIERCTFVSNHSSRHGGAIRVGDTPAGDSLTFVNCTFYNNVADSSGADISASDTLSLTNCILWSDSASVDRIWGDVDVTFSDILGGYPGAGNIDADPLFVNASNGDFHLTEDSPCINAGDPASLLDPDGSRADMGAYTFDGATFIELPLMTEPSPLDFGSLLSQDTVEQSLAFINDAGISAVITDVDLPPPIFTTELETGMSISANDTLFAAIRCFPLDEGSYEDTLTVHYWLSRPESLQVRLLAEVLAVPAAPESLTAHLYGENGIRLMWKPVTQTLFGHPITPSFYVIQAALSESGPFIPIGSSETTSFIHENIIGAQAIYFYRVTAVVEPAAAAKSGGSVSKVRQAAKEFERR